MLPFKALLVFEAVARNGSFTKAADELSVTQSAVSHQIKNLESYFSARLLDRSGAAIALTEEGEILYKDLSSSMVLLRKSISNLKAKVESGAIGVSIRPHFAMKWLSPRLSTVTFDFDFRFYHSIAPADFSDSNIQVSIEWRYRDDVPPEALLLVPGELTPACHPAMLASLENPSDPSILQHFVLLHEADKSGWQEWLQAAGVPDISPARNEYYSDTNVRQQAAMEKLGFALVCPTLVLDDIAAGRLVCPFDVRLDGYAYYLLVPTNHMNTPRVRTFVDWLKSEL